MKKIIIINPWIGKIGPNTFLNQIVNGLIYKKYKLIIIYPFKDSVSSSLERLGCTLFYIPQIRFKHINNFFLRLIYRLYGELRLFFFLRKNVNNSKIKYAIFNSELLSISLFSFSSKIPIYIIVHSLSFVQNKILMKIIFKIQRSFVDKYIAVSNTVKYNLKKIGVKPKIIMNYNGVDLSHYNTLSKPKNKIIKILSFVHPVPHKGAHHLINTLSLIKKMDYKYKCIIVGWFNDSFDIEYKKLIEDEILKNNLSKNIVFKSGNTNMKNNYLNSDILLHPSENESFGYILAEAMAMELPVVAFKVGAIPEVVKNEITGFLVEPYDIKSMSSYVIKLINNKKLRKELGEKGKERVYKKFDCKKNIKDLIENL